MTTPSPSVAKPGKAWLARESRQGRRAAVGLVGLNLLGTLCAVGQAWCLAALLAVLIGTDGPDESVLWPATIFAVLALLRAAIGVASESLAFRLGANARRRLRTDTLGRLLAAGPALLRAAHSAELAAVAVDRIEMLDGFFGRFLPASLLALATPILLAAIIAVVDPWAALLLIAAAALVPAAMAVCGIGAGRAASRQFTAMSRLQTRFLDRMRGIATIVMHGRVEDEASALGVAAGELRRRTMRVLRVAFLSSAAIDLAAAGTLVFLALRVFGRMAGNALEDPTSALFVLLLVPEFFQPLRNFSAAYQDQFHAHDAARELAKLPSAPAADATERKIRTVAAQGLTVVFDHVGLTWDAARGPVLHDISFGVKPGETLVVAGPSGAGKSSLIEILLGFVRPTEGRVTINGADIADLVPSALSRLTAWIGQKPVLFAGSLRENIRFARPEASDAEVDEAARFARVESFATHLPHGLDTEIGEGGFGLSGGQAQRVAIARAMLKNAPILLLDEPTAHLDAATEGEVLDSLRRLTLGRTTILVTHSAAAHEWNQGLGGRRIDLRDGRMVSARGVA
jgi:ATP-binding cassette, subfamily C, bacterial CydD